MSVIIKGMKMPKNCLECEIKTWDEGLNEFVCPFSGIDCLSIGRQDDCPLVELPEKPEGEVFQTAVRFDEITKQDFLDRYAKIIAEYKPTIRRADWSGRSERRDEYENDKTK